MATAFTAQDYERAADEYLASLPLEHFMEATPQSTQREITVGSLSLLKLRRRRLRYYNELLVQYFHEGNLRQVVPDNFANESDEPDRARKSFDVELEPVPPFVVFEYVSIGSERKDYKDSFAKYERELKVPYYILFHPEKQDLRVYRHNGEHYDLASPAANGRRAFPEWELEIGLVDGWMRFWHRGELLPLTPELQERVDRLTEEIARLRGTVTTLEGTVTTLQGEVSTLQSGLQSRDAIIRQQEAELQAREAALRAEQLRSSAALDKWRRRVAERAQKAGRQDILELLPTTADLDQLGDWFAELS